MVDMPQTQPPAYEQVVAQKLLECGLKHGSFTVQYEDILQSVEIVIGADSGAGKSRFDCIKQATGHEIVTFKDPELQQAYQDWTFEALKPKLLEDSRAALAKHGALDGFPERSNFASDQLFAEALERQCGMAPGSFFALSHGSLIGQPKQGHATKAEEQKLSCLMAAIMYVAAKGESFKFGFIGNEAYTPEN